MTAAGDFASGKRILLAEDEFLVGILLEDTLQQRGVVTLGPYTSLVTLRKAIQEEQFDAAVVDVNLGGEMVFPALDDLRARATPFLILTGYSASQLPDDYQRGLVLAKPYDANQLWAKVREILGLAG